ncbi:MAG: DNA adenine methylase [Anaerolineae bacterium]|nr:DNA adenine methylase [Anaerolineae bacterium]
MKVPHPIPYQGSKRNLAKYILPFFPQDVDILFEPFAGSAAISIAAAVHRKAARFHINDVNQPLVGLWNEIINHPKKISEQYRGLWLKQQGNGRKYYDFVRDEFNKTKRPEHLLYLLARCVKASVRYNANGEFNQSPDNRRLGRNPQQMTDDILSVSKLLLGKTVTTSTDYKEVLSLAEPTDLVYMDPPYQGVCATGDPRYFSGIDFNEFIPELKRLNKRNVPYILSYDGRTGKKSYGQSSPEELGMYRLEIDAGRSTQSTLLGRDDVTYESVYLSKNLVEQLDIASIHIINKKKAIRQPALFEL